MTRRTCTRCNRTGRDRGNWNGNFKAGILVEIICPTCQSIPENVEAEINAATTNYSVDAFGLVGGSAKGFN